jgi:hypothetical protein
VNYHVRISKAKMAGFGWAKRAFVGLPVVLTLLLALVIGLIILSVILTGGLLLAGWLWWWRRRLLQLAMKNLVVIEGECRLLDLGHAAITGERASQAVIEERGSRPSLRSAAGFDRRRRRSLLR